MLLPKIIQDGNAVIAWKRNGTREIIEGPKVLFAPFDTIFPLQQVCAREGEYLVIEFKDGKTEHREGPYEMWLDPLIHKNIYPKDVVNLDAHQAIVVYNDLEGDVTHRIIRGPAVYTPKPTEWLHQFRWHGDNGKGKKVPRALQFEKLRVIPDQLYFDVDMVRTADEALITVQLMVFFELTDIEKMLQQTHDPIADFINALTADVIRFAGGCDFEAFKNQAKDLNNLSTYTELCTGAERIGYNINKVVYRGYLASNKLQVMHDNAIELRTRLVLENETEVQQQELTDLKLTREHTRAEQIRLEKERELNHQLEQLNKERKQELETTQQEKELAIQLEKQEREQRLTTKQKEHTIELELTRQRHALEKQQKQELLQIKFAEWDHLHTTGADLTAVLVAQQNNPDKTIRLDHKGDAEVHLHEVV
jgi:hypothetical protein